MWKDYASYFPVNLVKEKDLDPKYNYIIGSHPHGILCSGAFCNFATEGTNISNVYPGITFTLTTLSCQYIMVKKYILPRFLKNHHTTNILKFFSHFTGNFS
jgi:hypothetical protein